MSNISQCFMVLITQNMRAQHVPIIAFCKKIGISESSFWRYKSGETSPSFEVAMAMLKELGLPIEGCIKEQYVYEIKVKGNMSINARSQRKITNLLEPDLLRAWKEAKEAAEALSPEFLADSVTQEEARNMHSEIGATIVSLTAAREKLEQFLVAA